jgi:FkbM family methyltransferase
MNELSVPLEEAFRRLFHSEGKSRSAKFLRDPLGISLEEALRLAARLSSQSWKRDAKLFWNQRFTTLFPDGVGIHIRRYGYFDYQLTQLFVNFIQRDSIIVDVGAHFGYFSVLASRLADRGRIFAIEPTPRTFAILQENMAEKPNVQPVHAAACAKPGSLWFLDYGPGKAFLNEIATASTPGAIEVPALQLDEFLKHNRAIPDLIKIDAERAELEVLSGLEQTLSSFSPLVILEAGDDPNHPRHTLNLIEWMQKRGFSCFDIESGGLNPHVPREATYHYSNLAFQRPS